jgi:hypothetical protein
MTLPPMPTVIVIDLDVDGRPPRKPAKQYVMLIELAERPQRSLLHPRRTPSLGAVLNRRSHDWTNCTLFAAANRASASIAATPVPLSP